MVKVVMVVVAIVVAVITFTMRMAALLRTHLSEGLSDNHQKKSDLDDRHANYLLKIFVPCFQVNRVFLNHIIRMGGTDSTIVRFPDLLAFTVGRGT